MEQGVERRDAQADQVRGRREVRLVGDASARVEADRPRLQPLAEVGGEVARLAVVACDDDGGLPGGERPVDAVEEPGDEVRAHRGRDERLPAFARQRDPAGVVGEMA